MNFGDKLKQLRNEKSMTQPQLAEAIGIEQSYLSKLENDKSIPSADMFQKIIATLAIDAKDFLKDIDKNILNGPLRQIPEVASFISASAVARVHNAKKWLINSALACSFGIALLLAGDQGIFFSNNQYQYASRGVILPNESEDIFNQFPKIINLKEQANILSRAEAAKAVAEFEANRVRTAELIIAENKGVMFFQNEANGRRKFELIKTIHGRSTSNKLVEFLGAVLLCFGIAGFFVEWRLRKLPPN